MMDKAVMDYRSRVVMALQTTASAADDYVPPSPGAKSQILRCIVTMGNDADLVLTPKTSDNATGTNARALLKTYLSSKTGLLRLPPRH